MKPVMSGWIDRTPFSPNPMSVKEWCDRTIFISTNDALGRRNFHREQWENSYLAKPWHEPWFPPDPDKKIRHRDVPKKHFQLGKKLLFGVSPVLTLIDVQKSGNSTTTYFT